MSLWGAIGSLAGALIPIPGVGPLLGSAIGGAVGNAIDGNNANRDALSAQQQSTDAAIGEQRRQFDLQRQDTQPYRETGVNALRQLYGDINTPVTSAEVMSDPGYQFGLDQGEQALQRRFGASGGRLSGASLKAASRFNVGTAASGYNAAYQRRQDRLNRLAALAGVGQSSTASSAQAGAASTNAISNMLTAQGNASGSARLAQGNIWGNAINQVGAAAERAYRPNSYTGQSTFRMDDPYRSPAYFGGDEGE
jgi:hypothetical protein